MLSLLIIPLGVKCKSFLTYLKVIKFSRTTVIHNRPCNRAFVYGYLISIWLHSLTITQEMALTFYENFSFMYSHSLRNVMLKSKFYLKHFLLPSRNFEGHCSKNALHHPQIGHNHAFVLIVFVAKQQVREYTS